MRGSGQRLPITLRFTRVLGTFSHTTCFPFSCALWACFSDRSVSGERSEPMGRSCRTRLCGWCSNVGRKRGFKWKHCFNTARGFVGGAALRSSPTSTRTGEVSMPHAAVSFRPHHRFAVPLPRSRRGGLVTRRFLAESRNISFPRRCGGSGEHSEPIGALMPHAALWVVQPISTRVIRHSLAFQCRTRLCGWCNPEHSYVGQYVGVVSMPHAALWVVQRSLHRLYHSRDYAK